MAKGWESKAVEDQIKEFTEKDTGNARRQLSSAELEVQRRRKVLLLSRTRVQNDLQSSENPRYREQLTRALADIDAQLTAIKDS
jgi:hypothetical protein